jgi:hypothetical protein
MGTRLRTLLTMHERRDEGEQLLQELSLPPLEELETLVEQIRADTPAGSGRAQVDTAFPLHRLRARRAHRAGRDEEGWSVLQELRARDLLEVLSAQSGEPSFRPPDLAEARTLLSRLPRPAAFVDIEGHDGALHASILTTDGFERVHAVGDLTPVMRLRWGDPLRRAADTVQLLRTDPLLRRLAEGIREVCGEEDLLLTTDDEYSNLPWHLIPVDGNQTWGRHQLLSRLPAVAVLRRDLGAVRSGHSLVAGDSRGDLPGAAAECGQVASLLGGDPLVGRRCSVEALAAPGPRLDFLHLAVHGYADSRAGGSSSLLFADDGVEARDGDGTRWISWAELVGLPWRARVVTFSGCSTAVGGPRHGRGLYGISQSAMNNGAGSVLASLWPVDDLQTAAFMTALYEDVRAQWDGGRDADLRLALRAGAQRLESRLSPPADTRRPVTRDAREFDLPGAANSASPADQTYAWSVADAFTLVGDPILARG